MNALYKNILKIKNSVLVKDVMTKNVVCLKPTDIVNKAVILMADKSISTIVVTDGGGLAGVLTERDMISRILKPGKDPKKTKIEEVMSRSPKFITPDASLLQASNRMKQERVRKLIVVDKDMEVIGLISQTDIINNLQKIDDSYRKLLGNPIFTFAIIAVVVLLFIIRIVFFRQ